MFPALVPVIGAAAFLTWLVFYPWHKSMHDMMLKLSVDAHNDDEEDGDDLTAGELRKIILQLPGPVKRYIQAVWHNTNDFDDEDIVPIARTMRMEQEGQFLLNGKYIPFTASQEFSTRHEHAGFVWDAVMHAETGCIPTSFFTLPINVCDAYINGAGTMKAQLPGGIPLVRQKDTPELNQGELMRWAAEAALFPLALLPTTKGETIKWLPSTDGDDNSATLELEHHKTIARMIFRFDADTHLVTSIEAKRPRAVDGTKYELTLWKGFFYDFELHGGLLVPTKMEVGWQLDEDEPLEIYFKGTNHNFIYLMNGHPHHQACDVKHDHVE